MSTSPIFCSWVRLESRWAPLFVMHRGMPHPSEVQRAFIRARARDAVSTPQISSELQVVAVRALRNKGLDEFNQLQMELIARRKAQEISQSQAQAEVENFWVGALRKAVQEGDVEHGSVMAGQSIGLVDRIQPLEQALAGLVRETREELDRVADRISSLGKT